MNGDGHEFAELRQEFHDFKEKQTEYQVDIKARLASMDASLSALAPIIYKHEERFNTIDQTCANIERTERMAQNRITRLEMGVVGSLVVVAGMFVTGIWQHIFKPVV
jgi:hypothetical protein